MMRKNVKAWAALLTSTLLACGNPDTAGSQGGASSSSGGSSSATTSTSMAILASSSSSGTGGSAGEWYAAAWSPDSCEVETARGPAPGIPNLVWESCGADCKRVVVDWYSGADPLSTISVRPDGGEFAALVQTDTHILAVAWHLPSLVPSFAIRTSLPCLVRPMVPTPSGYWGGAVSTSPLSGMVGYFTRDSLELDPEVVPESTGIVTGIVGDDDRVYLSTGDGNSLLRWQRGEATVQSFNVLGAQSPTLATGGSAVFLGGATDSRAIYRWNTAQASPTVAWSMLGRSALGLAAMGGQVAWLDGAGDATPGYTNIMARWAFDGPTLNPLVDHGAQGHSEIVADPERMVKASPSGIEVIDQANGSSRAITIQSVRGLAYLGQTPLSSATEVWVETIGTLYRIEVEE